MGTLRLPEALWLAMRRHLFGTPGEHFAFLLARWAWSNGEPVLLAQDAVLIPDTDVSAGWDGHEVSLEGVLRAVNAAARTGACLVEAHNHGGNRPRFSAIDRQGLPEFAAYIHASLPNRPYAATVWGDELVYGEYSLPDGATGRLTSITVAGAQLRQLVSRDDDSAVADPIFGRQLPWFTPTGQRMLDRLRIGVVGLGGTGSHVIQQLAYLGSRDLVVIDGDCADRTSLNRLVTATAADIGVSKVLLAERLVRGIAPGAQVRSLAADLRAPAALDALKGADVIFGCVDNDGARLVLNELAVAYTIPYFDLATGIETEDGQITGAGGRLVVVVPGGPCLHCLHQIDPTEARYFLSTPEEQVDQYRRGYVTGMDAPAPSVVSLNGAIASMAINELAVYVSGLRPVSPLTEYDLLGIGRTAKSQWLTPTRVVRDPGCVQCALAGLGDDTHIARYARPAPGGGQPKGHLAGADGSAPTALSAISEQG